MDANQLSLIIGLTGAMVGTMVSLIGTGVGMLSIVVAWKLYQAGNSVSLKALEVLAEIKASSHTTEVTSTRLTERLVVGLLEARGRDVSASMKTAEDLVVQRIDEIVDRLVKVKDPTLAQELRTSMRKELADSFRYVAVETATAARLPPPEAPATSIPASLVAPDIARLVRWLLQNEGKYKFFGVSLLHQKVFRTDALMQEALTYAIDNGIVETYNQLNPKNAERPTKACRLNREHPVVAAFLRAGT